MAVGFCSSYSINGLDETLGCELLPLSYALFIKDGALKFYHGPCEEEASRDLVCLIVS